MSTTPATLSAKLTAARKSLTVWASAAVPVILASAEALKEQLPAIGGLLHGWPLVALSVGVSALIAALRVRGVSTAEAKAAE